MKILIVEDHLPTATFMVEAVKSQKHEARHASDGLLGLNLFKEFQPDLVFADIQMENLDGLGMLEKIREASDDAIVIMTTAFGQEEYILKALRLHANDYVRKPLVVEQVLALLQKYRKVVETRTIQKEFLEHILRRAFTVSIDNHLNLASKVVNRLMLETGDCIAPRDRLGIHLGLLELLTNAIEHGNLDISYDEKTRALESEEGGWEKLFAERLADPVLGKRRVTIEFELNETYVQWIITDEGRGFDWNALPDPDSEEALFSSHGRGIILSKMRFEEFEYLGCGNSVRVRKYRSATPGK